MERRKIERIEVDKTQLIEKLKKLIEDNHKYDILTNGRNNNYCAGYNDALHTVMDILQSPINDYPGNWYIGSSLF